MVPVTGKDAILKGALAQGKPHVWTAIVQSVDLSPILNNGYNSRSNTDLQHSIFYEVALLCDLQVVLIAFILAHF